MGKVFCKPQDDSCDDYLSPKSKHIQFTSFDYNNHINDGKKVKICKVVVLGDDSISKTKLIRQYTGNSKMNKRLEVNNTIYDLAIWDVPNNIFFTKTCYESGECKSVITSCTNNESAIFIQIYSYSNDLSYLKFIAMMNIIRIQQKIENFGEVL